MHHNHFSRRSSVCLCFWRVCVFDVTLAEKTKKTFLPRYFFSSNTHISLKLNVLRMASPLLPRPCDIQKLHSITILWNVCYILRGRSSYSQCLLTGEIVTHCKLKRNQTLFLERNMVKTWDCLRCNPSRSEKSKSKQVRQCRNGAIGQTTAL